MQIHREKVTADDEANCNDVKKSYEELVAEYGKLPNGFIALAPILIPILLMGASSIASMAGWSGTANDILKFWERRLLPCSWHHFRCDSACGCKENR